MKYQARNTLFTLILGFIVGGVAMASDDYGKLEPCVAKIEAKMPKNWRMVEKKIGELPEWHYEGVEYSGPKGIYFQLVGNHDVDYYWKGEDGIWRKKPYFKEAIRLWLMPSEYHESWKKFFIFKGHVTAKELYRNSRVRIYGEEASYRDPSLPQRELKEEFPNATTYAGALGKKVQSWTSWKEDIKEALDACPAR